MIKPNYFNNGIKVRRKVLVLLQATLLYLQILTNFSLCKFFFSVEGQKISIFLISMIPFWM